MPRKAGPLHDGSNHGVDGPSQAQSQPSAEDVRAQLERLVASPDFDLPARAPQVPALHRRGDAGRTRGPDQGLLGRDRGVRARCELRRPERSGGADRGGPAPPRPRTLLSGPRPVGSRHHRCPEGRLRPPLHPAGRPGVEAVDPPAPATPLPDTSGRPPIPAPKGALAWLWRRGPCIRRHWFRLVGHLAKDPTAADPGIGGSAPSGPTLVVMPFANLGEGPEAKIYAQGLTEEVLSQLARFKELSVLGRETSRSIPPGADAVRIRRELGVRYVLEGSVRTADAPVAGDGPPPRCRDRRRAVVASL